MLGRLSLFEYVHESTTKETTLALFFSFLSVYNTDNIPLKRPILYRTSKLEVLNSFKNHKIRFIKIYFKINTILST